MGYGTGGESMKKIDTMALDRLISGEAKEPTGQEMIEEVMRQVGAPPATPPERVTRIRIEFVSPTEVPRRVGGTDMVVSRLDTADTAGMAPRVEDIEIEDRVIVIRKELPDGSRAEHVYPMSSIKSIKVVYSA